MVGIGLSGHAEGHPVQERHRAGAGIQAAGGDLQQDGTLTVGQPKVVEVAAVDNPLSEDGLVWLVTSAEQSSEHPLAQAVVDHAKERRLKLAEPTTFEAILGHGLRAIVDGRTMLVGNHKLMRDGNIALDDLSEQTTSLEGAGRTVVYAAVDGQAAGIIAIADATRPTARQMVAEMQQLGVQVVMLTGDNRAIPERIACELGVETVFAEVLPGQKADKVRDLQAQGKLMGMVGDGINDAPALAQANVGIARRGDGDGRCGADEERSV